MREIIFSRRWDVCKFCTAWMPPRLWKLKLMLCLLTVGSPGGRRLRRTATQCGGNNEAGKLEQKGLIITLVSRPRFCDVLTRCTTDSTQHAHNTLFRACIDKIVCMLSACWLVLEFLQFRFVSSRLKSFDEIRSQSQSCGAEYTQH